MCAPSTSASVIIIILWYLNLVISKSSCIPVPKAVIIERISSFESILSSRAFSTFNIFPLNGSIACVLLVLASTAEPPAELPSTIYISHFSGSLSEQSVSFPGSLVTSNADFLLTSSLAFFAASLACDATIAFSTIIFPISGFSSIK